VRRDGKGALFADAHPNKAFIPTFNDLSNADWEEDKSVSKIRVNAQRNEPHESRAEVGHGHGYNMRYSLVNARRNKNS
jgi:hypothetical protein